MRVTFASLSTISSRQAHHQGTVPPRNRRPKTPDLHVAAMRFAQVSLRFTRSNQQRFASTRGLQVAFPAQNQSPQGTAQSIQCSASGTRGRIYRTAEYRFPFQPLPRARRGGDGPPFFGHVDFQEQDLVSCTPSTQGYKRQLMMNETRKPISVIFNKRPARRARNTTTHASLPVATGRGRVVGFDGRLCLWQSFTSAFTTPCAWVREAP